VRRADPPPRGGAARDALVPALPAVAGVLSLRELERAARILDAELRGARLEKLHQEDDLRLVLSFRGERGAQGEDAWRHVLLSCDARAGRLAALPERPAAPREPLSFAAFLRKRVLRARCAGVRCAGRERQAAIALAGPEGAFDLLLSLLGPRSNVYLLDRDGVLRGALRPLEKTRRNLALGQPWRDPETPPPAPGEDRFASLPDAEWLAAIEAHYSALEGAQGSESLRERLGRAFAKERRALEKKLAAVRGGLAAAREADALRRQGELLKANLARLEPGAREAELQDFETGERVRVPLDPALSPRENVEAVFKRYRKRARSVAPLEGQAGALEAELAESAALAGELEALAAGGEPDPAALAAFAERPRVRRTLERHAPAPQAAKAAAPARPRSPFADLPARLRPRRYKSSAGLEIWVGRSDEGNDHLSTRLARGNDLFFHLDGSPGSHVVLRTEGRADPPSEALLDAAELAVHFSRQRDAARADVHVAPIKNVSKPRRAKPGLVYVTGGRSLHLRREPARLERVLRSRIEDE
jgi:predicted ribosome quality control (RQC) complex YloA/Tae2 family protein